MTSTREVRIVVIEVDDPQDRLPALGGGWVPPGDREPVLWVLWVPKGAIVAH